MKQQWQKIAARIDALSMRERAIVLVTTAAILIMLVHSLLLSPQHTKQQQLSERVHQDQSLLGNLERQIREKLQLLDSDPDAVHRARLTQLKQQSAQLQTELGDMQKGLVAPDRMPALLEDMLKQNGSLQLVSLVTLPPAPLVEPPAATPESKAQVGGNVYKHGVELVVRGQYLDMMNYLTQLEAMPWQLFWNTAGLKVDGHPNATLTLTVYTLSLDGKWLKL